MAFATSSSSLLFVFSFSCVSPQTLKGNNTVEEASRRPRPFHPCFLFPTWLEKLIFLEALTVVLLTSRTCSYVKGRGMGFFCLVGKIELLFSLFIVSNINLPCPSTKDLSIYWFFSQHVFLESTVAAHPFRVTGCKNGAMKGDTCYIMWCEIIETGQRLVLAMQGAGLSARSLQWLFCPRDNPGKCSSHPIAQAS